MGLSSIKTRDRDDRAVARAAREVRGRDAFREHPGPARPGRESEALKVTKAATPGRPPPPGRRPPALPRPPGRRDPPSRRASRCRSRPRIGTDAGAATTSAAPASETAGAADGPLAGPGAAGPPRRLDPEPPSSPISQVSKPACILGDGGHSPYRFTGCLVAHAARSLGGGTRWPSRFPVPLIPIRPVASPPMTAVSQRHLFPVIPCRHGPDPHRRP